MDIIELNNKIKELEKIIENNKYQITNNIIYQCMKCKSITPLDFYKPEQRLRRWD
jgi:hypothetical protein